MAIRLAVVHSAGAAHIFSAGINCWQCRSNTHCSVFELISVALSFGFRDEITNMVRRGHEWSKCIWREKG